VRQFLEDLTIIISLAAGYFVTVYFAVSALVPSLAYPAALVAVIIVLSIYRFLELTQSHRAGAPLGLLLFFPVICGMVGAIWWAMRWVGVWEIN